MKRVAYVFDNAIKRDDYWIDYYYDISEKSLILLLRSANGPFFRVTFEQVNSMRTINESWALLPYNLTRDDFPEQSRLGAIYELIDGDVIWPLREMPKGRHFYVFAENYHLDIYADIAPTLEEISEEEAYQPDFDR